MRLLIIEDQPRLLQALGRALREDGYAVDLASTGDEGLWKAETNDYDAILLDVMLPGRDGWAVLQALRDRKSTPVLLLTARDTLQERLRGLDLGADDYIRKPFDLPELLARLRAVLRRAAGRAGDVLTVRGAVLDMRQRMLSVGGCRVPLTAREYRIVEFLALHGGKVVSRKELHEHTIEEQDDALSNVIDVHISSIRRKVGPEFISTRRGLGYCIDTEENA